MGAENFFFFLCIGVFHLLMDALSKLKVDAIILLSVDTIFILTTPPPLHLYWDHIQYTEIALRMNKL